MVTEYFTFGSAHAHPNGYVKITATDWANARQEMIKRYGTKWAFQYDEEKALPMIEKWKLTEVVDG